MTNNSMTNVLRGILTGNLDMPAEEVVKIAKSKGVKEPEITVRNNVYNLRSELKKQLAQAGKPVPVTKPAPKAVPTKTAPKVTPKPATPPASTTVAVATPTPEPKAPAVKAPVAPKAAPAPKVAAPATVAAAPVDVAGIFANLRLVNTLVAECGGVESVRKVAAGIEACGSVSEFLRHVELVASLKNA